MSFNRFDIVEAHYWFAVDHHSGQWSDLYEKHCRISRYFRPGACDNGPTTDNARMIYNALCERHGFTESMIELDDEAN